jgi:type I restriction enzyme R subunit
MVGLDRRAARDAFSEYLDGKTFNADQFRFVNFIINHLTANGVMDESLLKEQPFTDIHEQGWMVYFQNLLIILLRS